MVSTVNQVYIYIKNLVSTKYIVYQVKLVYIYVYVYVYVYVYCTYGCRKDILIYIYVYVYVYI